MLEQITERRYRVLSPRQIALQPPQMRSYQLVPFLNIGRQEDCANVGQRHVEIAKAPDDLRDLNLLRGVAPIAGARIDLRGLEEPRLMIVTESLHREVSGAGEIANSERGRHTDRVCTLPLGESQESKTLLTLLQGQHSR